MNVYEAHITVTHHPRHLEDWPKHESISLKLRDTGNPREMVIYALREFADRLERTSAYAREVLPSTEVGDQRKSNPMGDLQRWARNLGRRQGEYI